MSQHPLIERPEPTSLDELFFRTERQVLVGLGQGWTGFSVKVEMTPWDELTATQQQRISESIRSMNPAMLSYKGLHSVAALMSNFH